MGGSSCNPPQVLVGRKWRSVTPRPYEEREAYMQQQEYCSVIYVYDITNNMSVQQIRKYIYASGRDHLVRYNNEI